MLRALLVRVILSVAIIFFSLAAAAAEATVLSAAVECNIRGRLLFEKDASTGSSLPEPVLDRADLYKEASSSHVNLRLLTKDLAVSNLRLSPQQQQQLSFVAGLTTAEACSTLLFLLREHQQQHPQQQQQQLEMPGFLYRAVNVSAPSWSWKPLGSVLVQFQLSTLNVEKQQQQHEKSKNRKGTSAAFILYDVWSTYAAWATKKFRNGTIQSVEEIIRSGGSLQLDDVYPDQGRLAQGFYYQSSPQLGPYCLWRPRRNSTTPPPPGTPPADTCPNAAISLVARRHAQQLLAMSIDVAVVDGTNLGNFDLFADVLQLRPAVVLAEEWAALRRQGVSTPTIAIWNVVTKGANLYQRYLDEIYNVLSLRDVVAKDARTGKKIFFVPENPSLPPDPSIIKAIESNGGRNDIIVQPMWALLSPEQFESKGIWQFMSPCREDGQYRTTSVANMDSCNQLVVTRAPLGSMTAVSPSYQVAYGSLFGQAAGKFSSTDFTFHLQFRSALQQKPQNIVLGTWNEFIAQPQKNPFAARFPNAAINSMGLIHDRWKEKLWVDTFGENFARGIEPSLEGGSSTFAIACSYMRLWQMMKWIQTRAAVDSSSSSSRISSRTVEDWCRLHRQMHGAEAAEAACQPLSQVSRNVWSLANDAGNDRILVINPVELKDLLASGWKEICTAFSGPNAFCVSQSVLGDVDRGAAGPFLLSTSPSANNISTSMMMQLWRCRTAGSTHFFSNSSNCEGQTVEFSLGFSSLRRTSEFPRRLLRCYDPQTGEHFHSLDLPCRAGSHEEARYGYVN